jgi:hypothetical protein
MGGLVSAAVAVLGAKVATQEDEHGRKELREIEVHRYILP